MAKPRSHSSRFASLPLDYAWPLEIEFRILGPLEVRSRERELSLGGAKQRALLAILLLHTNEVVSIDRLVDELWGDRPPATASKVVQVYVSKLRKAFEERHGRGEHEQVLVTRTPGYMLRVEPGQLDADRFERLVDQGRQQLASGSAQPAAHTLLEALALWRGPALADFALEPFAQSEIARLEEARITALEERIEADLALGRHAELVGELESLLTAHPLRERLRGQLMTALYRSGRQAEALETYRQGRRRLADDLGLEPGQALKRLERSILEQDPALGHVALAPAPSPAPPDPAVSPVPTGTVSFLFTDIEGSTRLVQELGDDYGELLETHRQVLREAFEPHGGLEIDTQGDAFFFAFRRARDAVAAAVAAQRALAPIDWPRGARVTVRIGIHTGEPGVAERGYHGLDVVRAARISGAAHGGQILVSNATRDLVGNALPEVTFSDLGEHGLKGIDQPERIFQAHAPDLRQDFPPLDTDHAKRVMTIRGREDQLAAAAGAALGAEERRLRFFRRSRWGVIVGALVLAGAAAGIAVALSGSGAGPLLAQPNSLAAIDARTNRVDAVIPVGAHPVAVAVGESSVWVANFDEQTVSRIDPATRKELTRIPAGGSPTGLAVGDGFAWVTHGFAGTLSLIDTGLNRITATLPLGSGVSDVTVTANAVWVVNGIDGTILRLDPTTGDLLRTITVGGSPTGVAGDAHSLWVADGRTLFKIDVESNRVVARIALRHQASRVAIGSSAVWVSSSLDNVVTRIDEATGSVATEIPVGEAPDSLAADTGAVWVADGLGGAMTRIDPGTNKVTGTTLIGSQPAGVALGHGSVWVTIAAP